MNETFELWDTATANLIGTYETEEAALADVFRALRAHGREALDTVILSHANQRGRRTPVAMGAELSSHAETWNRQQYGMARAGRPS